MSTTPSPSDRERQEIRELFGRFATGVIIATTARENRHVAVTMNSFATVSLDPPLVSICLGNHLRSRTDFETAPHFCVSILGDAQEDLSNHCARPGSKEWDNIPYMTTARGVRYIHPCIAALECDRETIVEAGDHSIVLGRVTALHPGIAGDPLLFFRSRYRRIAQ